jgi:hypothetical protein
VEKVSQEIITKTCGKAVEEIWNGEGIAKAVRIRLRRKA